MRLKINVSFGFDQPFQSQLRLWEHTPIETAADADMPPLTLDGFDKSCKAIKRCTGLGSDYFHPQQWLHLSEVGKQQIVEFLSLVEGSGHWPAHVSCIFFHLIPKVSGGLRTIGVLAGLVRTWEGMRVQDFGRWMQRHSRHHDWACTGRSPEAAVRRQLLFGETFDPETGELSDKAHVTVLLDIVKCFERLSLHQVWY